MALIFIDQLVMLQANENHFFHSCCGCLFLVVKMYFRLPKMSLPYRAGKGPRNRATRLLLNSFNRLWNSKKEIGQTQRVEKRRQHLGRKTFFVRSALLKLLSMLKTTIAELLRSKRLGTKNLVVNGISFIASVDKIKGGIRAGSGNTINQPAQQANPFNKVGKVAGDIMNRFNVLFAEYIVQQQIQLAIRKRIREAKR